MLLNFPDVFVIYTVWLILSLSWYLFLTAYLIFSGSSWSSILASKSPSRLANVQFFTAHLIKFLALVLQWTFTNCTWKLKVEHHWVSIIINRFYIIIQWVQSIQNYWPELDELSFLSLLWELNRFIIESFTKIKLKI